MLDLCRRGREREGEREKEKENVGCLFQQKLPKKNSTKKNVKDALKHKSDPRGEKPSQGLKKKKKFKFKEKLIRHNKKNLKPQSRAPPSSGKTGNQSKSKRRLAVNS